MIYLRIHRKEKNPVMSAHYGKLLLCLFLAVALSACGSSSGGGGDDPAASGTVSAPENVSVTASDASVTVTWDNVSGATSYNVYWKNDATVSKIAYDGVVSEDVSPCIFTGLTNNIAYYYVVTAVGDGGESPESLMVGAIPRQPLSAPQFVSAQPTPDTTNSITISWPDVQNATSYNIYWDVIPGVTKNTGTLIQFVQAPYAHTGLPGQTTYYYVVTAVDDTLVPVEESNESSEVSATARGPKTPVGGHDEGFGNNLSVPVVFANGYGITGEQIQDPPAVPVWEEYSAGLRPTATDISRLASLGEPFPYFDPTKTISIGGVEYYTQATTSTWQAEWDDGSGVPQHVKAAWGDNLVSAPLRTTQMIRVETVLTQDNATDMKGYLMQSLYGSMRNEVFGTDGSEMIYPERMVFSPNARLTVEQLDANGNPVTTTYDMAIYESFGIEGPGGYASEINGKGSLTYGYNWKPAAAGAWRITFSLDTDCQGIIDPCDNTVIDSVQNGTLISDHAVQIEVNVQ